MLFMGWTPMVDPTHAICIIATYTVCIGWPVIVIIFADPKESKITVFKTALYKGIIINSLIITTGRLYLSNASQDNIFCNDLFQYHQLPRWVYAICIMSITFSTWFKFKPALWLNAAQVGVPKLFDFVCIECYRTRSKIRKCANTPAFPPENLLPGSTCGVRLCQSRTTRAGAAWPDVRRNNGTSDSILGPAVQ